MSDTPHWLELTSGHRIAHWHHAGNAPGVMFLGGFRSDMGGEKALALEAHCLEQGHQFTRFDYRGHGQSDGVFELCTISDWLEDARQILCRITQGPQLLVGSSMGAWIALLLAIDQAPRIAGLLTIAAAPDFTEDLLTAELDAAARASLAHEGIWLRPNAYDEAQPYPITRQLLEDGRQHLLLRDPIALDLPTRLLHGQCDEDIPWQTSLTLAAQLSADDVRLTLIKDGDHRLSRPRDLQLLLRELDDLIALIV